MRTFRGLSVSCALAIFSACSASSPAQRGTGDTFGGRSTSTQTAGGPGGGGDETVGNTGSRGSTGPNSMKQDEPRGSQNAGQTGTPSTTPDK